MSYAAKLADIEERAVRMGAATSAADLANAEREIPDLKAADGSMYQARNKEGGREDRQVVRRDADDQRSDLRADAHEGAVRQQGQGDEVGRVAEDAGQRCGHPKLAAHRV